MYRKSRMKQFASVCVAAMMMTAVSVDMAGMGLFQNTAGITASAAASSIAVSAEKYGLSVPAESVSVQRNGIVIKDMTWKEFVSGTSIISQTDSTLVVLQYSDGTLELNAFTGEVVSNTRKSGVYRDKFYIAKEVFADFAKSSDSSTIIDPFMTKDSGEFKAESTYLAKDFELYVVTTERDSAAHRSITYLNDTPYTTDDLKNGRLEFDYPAGEKIYLVYGYTPYLTTPGAASVPWTGFVAEYDVKSQSIVSWYQSVTSPATLYFTPDSFPAEQGYENVVVTGHGLMVSRSDYGTIVTSNGSPYIQSVTYTPDEFMTGKCYVSTINALYGYMTRIDELVKVRFNYADGSYADYAVVGSTFSELTDEERTVSEPDSDVIQYIKDNTDDSVRDIYDNPLYNAEDGNGSLQISNELLNTPERDYDYSVEIYRGAEMIKKLSKADYEDTTTKIDYDGVSNYYVKVYLENGIDYTVHRYYPCFGSWAERVDTEQTPMIQQQVSAIDFPTEYSECNVYYSGKNILNLTAEDFGNSDTFSQITNMSANYAVVFRTDGGDAEYTYIGIDAEPLGDAPSETLCKKEDLTEIILHPSDDTNVTEPDKPVFHVDGKTETGEHISGDVFPVLSDDTAVVELPDGDYTITDLNSGLTTDITVDKDSSGNGAGNGAGGTQGNGVTDVGGTPVVEAQPEQVNQITVKTPDGTVILTDDTTGSAEDLNPDSLDGSAYFEYESVTGTANSVNDGERKEEHGYFVVKDGEITVIGDVLKGDVNLDGKVDVLDAVTAQKYLHQDKKLKFGVENYIAMDVHGDGIPNIYDFVTLKQMLLK